MHRIFWFGRLCNGTNDVGPLWSSHEPWWKWTTPTRRSEHADAKRQEHTQDEVAHMRTLFQQHPSITRDVKNIENGIVTTTLSDDPKVADALINHVAK